MRNLGFEIDIENILFGNASFCILLSLSTNTGMYIQGCRRLRYIQHINIKDKSFTVKNAFLDEQEQFRVFVVFKRGISK
jgi:hypothetical protein